MSDGWNSDEERRDREELKAEEAAKARRGRGGFRGGRGGRFQSARRPDLELRARAGTAGRIIGRGGANIKRLQQDSGATIKVNGGGDDTVVCVYGPRDAVDRARALLEPFVAEPEPPRTPTSPPPPAPPPNADDDGGYKPIDWEKLNEMNRLWEIERAERLGPIIKDVYDEHPRVAAMTPAEITVWRRENNDVEATVLAEDDDAPASTPNPITEFRYGFSRYPELMDGINRQGFSKPTPIQAMGWPVLLKGHDMIGVAQTGTGKTLAFLFPALLHIEAQPTPRAERKGPNVLVLAPTRELVLQIKKECDKYSYKRIKSACIYSGGSRTEQIEALAEGVQIVIATPERLNDLVDSEYLNFEAVTYLVLDEAGRMLDMGFEPQIRRSLTDVRPDRQTVMTSATWPSQVQRLAASYTKNPIQVVVGTLDLTVVHTVKQQIEFLEEDQKFPLLLMFLRSVRPNQKVIVFCSKKFTTTWVSSELGVLGLMNFQSIYSGLDQCDRERAVEQMQTGEANILIATDVASRGLDIEDVTHVINYDFPHNMEEYVHRVGRTGRAGKKGTAISYMTREDSSKAEELIRILSEAGQEVPEELSDMSERFKKMMIQKSMDRYGGRRGGRRGHGRSDFEAF